MVAFFIRSLDGIEHQSSHHQVQEHSGENNKKGGALHDFSSAVPFLLLSTTAVRLLRDRTANATAHMRTLQALDFKSLTMTT